MPHAAPTSPAPDAAALVDRLATLERDQRRLRRLTGAAVLACLALLVTVAASRPGSQPGAASGRVVLTAPNGQTTATLALDDDGTLHVRIAGTVRAAGRAPGAAPRDVLVRGEFAFVPGTVPGSFPGLPGARQPEVRVLEDGRVLAQLGGPLARQLVP